MIYEKQVHTTSNQQDHLTADEIITLLQAKKLCWLDLPVSLYSNHFDTSGRRATLREIILSEFIHFLPAITSLKNLNPAETDYDQEKRRLKSTLALYAMNLLSARTGEILQHNPLVQLDFDFNSSEDLQPYMEQVFNLPFTAFVGRSCSGRGFFAILLIGEPEKQKLYVEHCFRVFKKYGFPIDTSKGRNYNDLRYVSYDPAMMIKDYPTPLIVKNISAPKTTPTPTRQAVNLSPDGTDGRIICGLAKLRDAQKGYRWQTVQQVAFTFGGIGGPLHEIIDAINTTAAFAGEEAKYIKCARDCYQAGTLKPLEA